ncbi:MAG: hypothetical protein ACREEK_00860, partial [Bradyrhizobium sp.]
LMNEKPGLEPGFSLLDGFLFFRWVVCDRRHIATMAASLNVAASAIALASKGNCNDRCNQCE